MDANEGTPSRLARLVPALDWLRHYDRRWLSKDIVGGLAAGSVDNISDATLAGVKIGVGLTVAAGSSRSCSACPETRRRRPSSPGCGA